jgi:pantoate--beta-alanine ligase
MEIINRRQRMASLARKLRRENKTVGFVATMGALHAGHLSLVKEARQMCDVVIVSIFVNPVQFNEKEDFAKYPRDLTTDAALLTDYQVDYIFAPETQEIYAENFSTYVYVEHLTETLEGAVAPRSFSRRGDDRYDSFQHDPPGFCFFRAKRRAASRRHQTTGARFGLRHGNRRFADRARRIGLGAVVAQRALER